MILGSRAELQLRRALQLSDGDLSGLFEPLAVGVYAVVTLILLWPLARRFLRQRTPEKELVGV